MSVVLIEENLLFKERIINRDLPEGQAINDFLLSRAKNLAGKYIDFDRFPVTFVLSEREDPNAFFAPISEFQNKPRLSRSRDDRKNIVFTPNPYDTPVICVTKGLIEMVENLDQLDYILGHELTHLILRGYGAGDNSKGEEEIADLHAIDLVYDAGGDPKQALVIADKIRVLNEERKEQRRRGRNADEEGINWSEVFSPYMTSVNRKSAIEASLTRISHLIDDREPTELDKSIFLSNYSDRIEVLLEQEGYKDKGPLEKLKTLIDMVDLLSEEPPSKKSVKKKIKDLSFSSPEGFVPEEEQKILKLRERKADGFDSYFSGKVMEARYKQKITHLTEEVFNDIYRQQTKKKKENGENVEEFYPQDELDPMPALIYLQDKAYEHILKHGYPAVKDMNYHDASSMLYSFFYAFLINKTPHEKAIEYEVTPFPIEPQIITDINATKTKIRSAENAAAFTDAYMEMQSLYSTLLDIRSISFGYSNYGSKMENLSLLDNYRHIQFDRTSNAKTIYGAEDRKSGQIVPWNNLTSIAKEDEKTQNLVAVILAENGIRDYRVTHGLSYVKLNNQYCYKINENGVLSEDKIPEYELDFALNKEDVLAAYDYVRSYIDHEDDYIDQICENALKITEDGFKERLLFSDSMNDPSYGKEWAYDLISAFNSLPDTDEDFLDYKGRNVLYAIPGIYRRANTIPGTDKDGKFQLNDDLFEYKNPIFQEYCESDLQEQIKARKQAQQQKLFETSFKTIENLADIWLSVSTKQKKIEQELKQLGGNKGKTNFTEEEWSKLSQQADLLRSKADDISSIVYNLTFSVFKDRGHEYNIQKLTSEQKLEIVELVVRDKKGIFLKLFSSSKYEKFCDYLNVLSEQTERVMKGNYELTPMMSIVANNLGYKSANNREEIERLVHSEKKETFSETKYTRYLNAFDLTRYLSQSSEIDISVLAKAFLRIKMSKPDSYGRPSKSENALYNAYEKFITSNNVLELISKAIHNKENYANFTLDKNIEVIADLVKFRQQMGELLEKKKKSSWDYYPDEDENEEYKYDYSVSKTKNHIRRVKKTLTNKFQTAARGLGYVTAKEKLEKRNEEFLEGFDEGLNKRLREAEQQILGMGNALDKIKELHWFYKEGDDSYSGDPHRTKSLYKLNKTGGNLKKIAELSKSDSFWPENTLEHIKAFIFAKQTFIDDIELENNLLNKIYDKIESLPPGKNKNECLHLLLDKELRGAYPETRQRLFNIYTKDIFAKLGHDDGTGKYQNRLAVYLKAIEGGKPDRDYSYSSDKKPAEHDDFITRKMSSADKYIILRQVSDTIISQEQTSEMFKKPCHLSLDAYDLQRSYLYGIGIDTLTSDLDKNPETANNFLKFLNSKGEMNDCEIMSAHMQKNIKEREKLRDYQDSDVLKSELEKISPEKCKLLYDNFWAAPLKARAVLTARMLKSAAYDEKNDNQSSWEAVFDVVMENIIHSEDESIEAKYAQDIMHSYIKSRSDYERELILSAMMVANRNIGEDAGNVGKALKLFLENMGPAEIKLGQAIASHPNTPDSIRHELQDLKNVADIPARWTVYDWIKNENIPEEFWKNQYLGKILGSASYYTTIELCDDEVLRILRPEAREKAKKGFKVIGETVEDLKEKDQISDLDYKELTSSVQEMVKQAARMSNIETDHDIGQTQYECAQEIYNGVTIHSGAETFTLKVMDWNAKGKNWMKLKKAKGHLFNDLPENNAAEIAYKKQFAKGYITFELVNILSGKKFDHDKHGAQLCINPETNEVGIFDTGAMALNDPTETEQRLLGNVIYDVIKTSIIGEKSFTTFSKAITKKIDELHESNVDTQYLVEIKKGILALGDFFNVLDENDIQEIMPGMEMLSQLSISSQQGVYERMSAVEKAQLQVFSATRAFKGNKSVTIYRNGTPAIISDVANITTDPTVKGKSEWLSETFTHPGKETISDIPSDPHKYQPHQLTASL